MGALSLPYLVCPSPAYIMIKTCALLAVAAGTATASPWAGQALNNAAFVGAPVGRSSPWGLGTRWLSSTPTTARVGSVSRSAATRLDAVSMKLGEDEKVRARCLFCCVPASCAASSPNMCSLLECSRYCCICALERQIRKRFLSYLPPHDLSFNPSFNTAPNRETPCAAAVDPCA